MAGENPYFGGFPAEWGTESPTRNGAAHTARGDDNVAATGTASTRSCEIHPAGRTPHRRPPPTRGMLVATFVPEGHTPAGSAWVHLTRSARGDLMVAAAGHDLNLELRDSSRWGGRRMAARNGDAAHRPGQT